LPAFKSFLSVLYSNAFNSRVLYKTILRLTISPYKPLNIYILFLRTFYGGFRAIVLLYGFLSLLECQINRLIIVGESGFRDAFKEGFRLLSFKGLGVLLKME
jgi:hypothetical protein